jgi:CubicO group peptidase (beta-lactamase class C family)
MNNVKIITTLKKLFEPRLKKTMKANEIPGFCIAVVKNSERLYAETFGVKNLNSKERLSIRSLFHMASLTKPFVATAIMQLVEKDKIDLEKPIIEYLPYFKLKSSLYKTITIRQMLSHTSGMPDVEDYEWDKPVYDNDALEKYVRSLADEELVAVPGESYNYSNMAYEVLGDLIAKTSGKFFEEYIQKHILIPLGMKDSTLIKNEANSKLLTSPHVLKNSKVVVNNYFPYNRIHAPSSTLISNLVDMSRWAIANLNYGKLGSKRILKKSSYAIMWKPRKVGINKVNIGWKLDEYRGNRIVYHGGHDTGFRSYIMLLPDKVLGIMATSNFDETPILQLVTLALDTMLGFEL